MAKKLLFIVNPYSGKGRLSSKILGIVDMFTKNGYDVTLYPTQKRGDATEVAVRLAEGFDRVVCAGGDGTLNEVVNGYMNKGVPMPPLGYIPCGTTNDFSKTLKIPRDAEAAAEIAVTGEPFPCDVGRFNDSHFIYSAVFGAFSDVPYITPQSTKSLLGHAAYVLKGIERLSSLKRYTLEIEREGETISGDFILGMVTNSESVAGFKKLAGLDVSLDDGLFEVLLIKMPNSLQDLYGIANALLAHKMDSSGIYSFRTASLKIRSEEPLSWTLDGEFGGEHRQMQIDTVPGAVSYVVKDHLEGR